MFHALTYLTFTIPQDPSGVIDVRVAALGVLLADP